MSKSLYFDDVLALPFIDHEKYQTLSSKISNYHDQLHQKTGTGSDFTGWIDLPANIGDQEIAHYRETSEILRSKGQTFVMLGIGGSYLGARSAIEIHQAMHAHKNHHIPEIFYAGQHLSAPELYALLNKLESKDVVLNVVSKSGSTLETRIAFENMYQWMQKKYSASELKERIIITTDASHGPLRALAQKEGYLSFPVPENIGGRYSLFTAVGLLPMAVMGINIQEMLDGARLAQQECSNSDNPAYRYALLRNTIQNKEWCIEVLATFEPCLYYLTEWWKQLFGESEGKNAKGLFPANLRYTTDLHSMGQYMQEGQRRIIETFLTIDRLPSAFDSMIDPESGAKIETVNKIAGQSTISAHAEGGLPCLHLRMKDASMHTLGYLYYFFMKACAMSGYMQELNPFNQPGVERYKHYLIKGLKKIENTES